MIEDNTYENNIIKIGKNAYENDQLIKEAKQTDLWFHLASFPSSHVVLSVDKNHPVTKNMIKYCAQLVKENTKYRNSNLKINYCQIKNVKRTDTSGEVILKGKVDSIIV